MTSSADPPKLPKYPVRFSVAVTDYDLWTLWIRMHETRHEVAMRSHLWDVADVKENVLTWLNELHRRQFPEEVARDSRHE